ncbi:hypothetical protein [Vibrio sp. DNB22_19_2]
MIGTTITSYECNFERYGDALYHLKQNKNGTIKIIKREDGSEQFQWVGMYSKEYSIEILRAYLESGIKISGFEDVGLCSSLGGKLMFADDKIYTQPLGFSTTNEISVIHQKLKNVNFFLNRRTEKFANFEPVNWRVPTSSELCIIFSTGLLSNDRYWFSNDIEEDVANCKNSSYCGKFIDFSTKKVEEVRYHEARNSAADLFFCPSENKGYNVKPSLVVVRDSPKSIYGSVDIEESPF